MQINLRPDAMMCGKWGSPLARCPRRARPCAIKQTGLFYHHMHFLGLLTQKLFRDTFQV